jgi:hypothetical protein
MANIYMQAERVLVWMGYDEPDHDDCKETMHTLIKLAKNLPDTDDGTLTSVLDDYDDFLKVESGLLGRRRRLQTLEHEEGWRSKRDAPDANAQRSMISRKLIRSCNLMALDSFVAKSWFKRVWVVQEFVLARDIELFAGLDCIIYPHFEAAVFAIHKHRQLLSQSRPKTDRSILPRCVQSIEDVAKMLRFRSANRHSRVTIDSTFSVETTIRRSELPEWLDRSDVAITVKRSLYQCFRMFTHRYCSDERDRVYAALGLTGDDLAISPDYSLSLVEVLLQLSRKTLLAGELAVLHHTEPEERDAQPSFIPRVRDDFPLVHAAPLGGDIIPRYTAGCLRDSFASLFGSSSICIPGVSVDVIVYTDLFINVLEDLTTGVGSSFKPQLSDAYECAKNAYAAQTTGNPYGSITFQQAFWQTLHLGFVLGKGGLSQKVTGVDLSFLDYAHRASIGLSLHKRLFFMTSDGYIGLGSLRSKKGDRLVILDRGETPFVLRQAGVVDGVIS